MENLSQLDRPEKGTRKLWVCGETDLYAGVPLFLESHQASERPTSTSSKLRGAFNVRGPS